MVQRIGNNVSDLWILNVVAELSSGAVLTLEFSSGERVDFYAKLHPEAMPRSINALVRLMLQRMFQSGMRSRPMLMLALSRRWGGEGQVFFLSF